MQRVSLCSPVRFCVPRKALRTNAAFTEAMSRGSDVTPRLARVDGAETHFTFNRVLDVLESTIMTLRNRKTDQ